RIGGQKKSREREVARIAYRQHGLVTRAQLLDAAASPRQVERRIGAGALLPVHRGVYRVGHQAPSTEATYMAAVLAAGEGAVLSGLAAAHLHGLVKGAAPRAEVTARKERRIEGVKTRRCRSLNARDMTRV